MQEPDGIRKAARELAHRNGEGGEGHLVPEDIVEQLPNDVNLDEILQLLELQDDHEFNARPDPPEKISSTEITRCCAIATVGLQLLSHLHSNFLTLRRNYLLDLVTCLAAFTDDRDAWTTTEASKDAHCLLEELGCFSNAKGCKQARDLIRSLLEEQIKPYFARTKTSGITRQGRKAISSLPDPVDFSETEMESKPWKFQNLYAVTVFRWVLGQLDASALEENWPLIIPPLLAILDDGAIDNKVKGCELLVMFLKITPPSLLHRTGLGDVFHDALMPCLSYLPTLTPEDESLRLLGAVYPTLLILIRAKNPEEDSRKLRLRSLDRILRTGVLRGYSHAGEYVRIGEMLVDKIADLVNEMGIWSVKHLKDLVPLVSEILSSPFSTAYTPLLHAATRALDAIILNNWPRVSYYRGDIWKALAICWCRMQEEQVPSQKLQSVAHQLQQTSKLLTAALKATNIDVDEESAMLIKSNASLKELLEA
ncbi:MAG: hypothetical protein Q9187_000748 [Circinaria calcarea]